MYVLSMYYVCTIYALCMHYVCTMYVLCMYYVCTMYVLCTTVLLHTAQEVYVGAGTIQISEQLYTLKLNRHYRMCTERTYVCTVHISTAH